LVEVKIELETTIITPFLSANVFSKLSSFFRFSFAALPTFCAPYVFPFLLFHYLNSECYKNKKNLKIFVNDVRYLNSGRYKNDAWKKFLSNPGEKRATIKKKMNMWVG
jgi:hypothetical protein